MKKVDISNIIEGVRQLGATGQTLAHLVEAIQETSSDIVQGLTGNSGGVIVLYGLVNTGVGPAVNISAGACWYNGEIFDVDAFSGTPAGGQTTILSIDTTYRSGDPVKYSNNQLYTTHAIRKLKLGFGTSGAGVSDYSDVTLLKDKISTLLGISTLISASAASTLTSAESYTDAGVASAKSYADGLVTGLWDDRGGYNPTATSTYPITGGSGAAGAIKKGDIWTISGLGAGNPHAMGSHTVYDGDTARALVDSPGTTDANWAVQASNIGYTPVNKAGDSMSGPLAMGGNKITGLAAGSASGEAVSYEQLAVLIPPGSMLEWPKTTAPTGWLVCDGSAVSRTTYAALFAAIGTTFGAGDGSTTFNLPNCKQKFSTGYDATDTDYNAIGKTGGEKTHALIVAELAEHDHLTHGQNGIPGASGTGPWYLSRTSNRYAGSGSDQFGGKTSPDNTLLTGKSGNGTPHENRPPFIVLNKIIKT